MQDRLNSAAWELEDHTEILKALERRKGLLARQLLTDHMQRTQAWLKIHAVRADGAAL